MLLIFDIETNGLYQDVSRLWCLTILNTYTREITHVVNLRY
nr:MAG TPA: hypothetical protein [Bacteriophage sp.]